MPQDATNPPFLRSAPFRSNNFSPMGQGDQDRLNAKLSLENILLEEFNYASVTAYQSMEDRARVSNLYYVLLGTLTTGLVAILQFGGNIHVYSQPLAVGLLVVGGILSYSFFLKIIRLRQAHRHSLICMNVIKEFYILQFQVLLPQVKYAFQWRLDTMPAGERLGSVTFIMSSLIAFMGSVFFALAVFVALDPDFLGRQSALLPHTWGEVIASGVLLFLLGAYYWYYRRSFNKKKEKQMVEKLEKDLGIALLNP